MTIHTFNECVDKGWDSSYDIHRDRRLKFFPHSVVVLGNDLEHDMAYDWLVSQFGGMGGKWHECFYAVTRDDGTIDIDYGFCEYFFKVKSHKYTFRKAVGKLCAEMGAGNKI
jgi:hypothetical protein